MTYHGTNLLFRPKYGLLDFGLRLLQNLLISVSLEFRLGINLTSDLKEGAFDGVRGILILGLVLGWYKVGLGVVYDWCMVRIR